MPKRHLLRKKSHRTKPNNQRAALRKRGVKPTAAKPPRSDREQLRFERGQRAIADMLGESALSFSAAARKWKVDRRWLRKHFSSDLQKSSSGRIRAKVRNPRHNGYSGHASSSNHQEQAREASAR